MTIEQWRKTPEMLKFAADLLNNPIFQEWLDAVEHASPPTTGANDPYAMIRVLGRREGFDMALAAIRSMATPLRQASEPQVKYAKDL